APKNLFIIYCLPGDTVMQGLVPFKASDGLISNNVLDLNGDSQTLTDYMTRSYKGQLVEISLNGNLPFKSTPEHELLVLRSRKNHKGQTWRPHWGTSPKSVKESVPAWISAAEVLDSDFLLCLQNSLKRPLRLFLAYRLIASPSQSIPTSIPMWIWHGCLDSTSLTAGKVEPEAPD